MNFYYSKIIKKSIRYLTKFNQLQLNPRLKFYKNYEKLFDSTVFLNLFQHSFKNESHMNFK